MGASSVWMNLKGYDLKMIKHLIFFDWDDTLSDFLTRRIPDSAREALRQLSLRDDTLIGIASGRAAFFFKNQEIHFDVLVTNNGQYVELNDQIILENITNPKDIEALRLKISSLEGSLMGIHSVKGVKTYLYPKSLEILQHPSYIALKDYGEDVLDLEKVHILLAGYDPRFDQDMEASFPQFNFHRYNGYMVDVIPKGSTKLEGIEKVAHHLGLGLENVIAFGDSMNDYDMIKGVGLGIAMGNAQPAIKACAKMVTSSIHEDGIYRALLDLKLIKENV